MTTEIPVTQARDELAELINRVAYGHERIILTRHSKPVACLVPPEDLQRLEPQAQETIRLASTGQPPEISQSIGAAAPLRIAAQNRPPGPTAGLTSETAASFGLEQLTIPAT